MAHDSNAEVSSAVKDRLRLALAFLVIEHTEDGHKVEQTVNHLRFGSESALQAVRYLQQAATATTPRSPNEIPSPHHKALLDQIDALESQAKQKDAEIERLQQLLVGVQQPAPAAIANAPKKVSKAKQKQSASREQAIDALSRVLAPQTSLRSSVSVLAGMQDFRNTVKIGKQPFTFKPVSRSFLDRLGLLENAVLRLSKDLLAVLVRIFDQSHPQDTSRRMELFDALVSIWLWACDCTEEVIDHNDKLAKRFADGLYKEVQTCSDRIRHSLLEKTEKQFNELYRLLHAASISWHRQRLRQSKTMAAARDAVKDAKSNDLRNHIIQALLGLLQDTRNIRHANVIALGILSASTVYLELICGGFEDDCSELKLSARRDGVYLLRPLLSVALRKASEATGGHSRISYESTLKLMKSQWSMVLAGYLTEDSAHPLGESALHEILALYEDVVVFADGHAFKQAAMDVIMYD